MLQYTVIDDKVNLQWDAAVGAVEYIVYKKVKETDKDYIVIADTNNNSYTDLIADKSILYAPQIKMLSERQYGLIKFNFLDNILNRKTIEYYVEYLDSNRNVISSSDKVIVELNKNITDFYYIVKKDGENVSDTSKFIQALEQCATITNLNNGRYIIYCYSIFENRKSEISSLRFFIDNTIFDDGLTCDIPNGVKYNNRYRGPHESKKKDNFINIAKNNLNKLRKRFELLDEYQKELYGKADIDNISIASKIEEIKVSINDKREELKYEKRNN